MTLFVRIDLFSQCSILQERISLAYVLGHINLVLTVLSTERRGRVSVEGGASQDALSPAPRFHSTVTLGAPCSLAQCLREEAVRLHLDSQGVFLCRPPVEWDFEVPLLPASRLPEHSVTVLPSPLSHTGPLAELGCCLTSGLLTFPFSVLCLCL